MTGIPERHVLPCDQIRNVDRVAISEWGIPGAVLMENAGRGVADVMCDVGVAGPVAIVCAKGNNGGDGFVIARHLHLRGFEVQVILACDASELSGDAAFNYHWLRRTSVPVRELASLTNETLADTLCQTDWVVDALLGTGAQGAPREPLARLITTMNQTTGKKLAVDIPSGLNATTGEPSATTFRADLTCTFVAEKEGFENPAARSFLGEVCTLDIGLPWEMVVSINQEPLA